MSIWGKIIGGAAGFALGGPLGALLGGLAGHVADRFSGEVAAPEDGTQQIAFTIGVIALSAKMAKADGRVTRDEVQVFRQLFHVPEEEVANVGRVFDLARRDAAGFETYARQIARLFEEGSPVLEDLLHSLFRIAKADGVVHPAELEYLQQVADIFGLDESRFAALKAMHVAPDGNDPYAILGVAPDSGMDAIKSAYRKLVREHHPDRLIAQGVPQEFVDLATGKLARINEAYDEISRRRGLN